MSIRSHAGRKAASLLLALAPAAASAQTPAELRRRYQDATLTRAREAAARKLETPECQRLLAEFRDAKGRSLADNLASWNKSPSQYLLDLAFRDGAFHPLCRSGHSILVAEPGRPPVFVCPSFRKRAARDPWAAESWVIHEMLHTLGLGENPPTSREITARVNDSCG